MKFVRKSYGFRTNLVRISREFRPICSFCSCIASCALPLSEFVPCTHPHICRSRSPPGRRIFGTTPSGSTSPGPDCPRSTPSPPKAPVATSPQAPAVDRRQARPAVCAVGGAAFSTFGRQGGQHRHEACGARGGDALAVPRRVPRRPHRPPPGPGHPSCQAAGSGLDPAGAARARWASAASQCCVGHGVAVAGGAGHLPHLLPLPHCGPGGGATCLRGRSRLACLPTSL